MDCHYPVNGAILWVFPSALRICTVVLIFPSRRTLEGIPVERRLFNVNHFHICLTEKFLIISMRSSLVCLKPTSKAKWAHYLPVPRLVSFCTLSEDRDLMLCRQSCLS